MSDVSASERDRFTFTYTEEELWALSKLVQRRQDLGPAVDVYWSVIVGAILAVGLVPFAALSLGLIGSSAFQPVLATAYIAFIAGGLAFWAVMAMRSRGLARANFRIGRGSGTLEYIFDNTDVVFRGDMLETRMPWRAVKGIENAGAFVIIWLHDHQAVGLPARLFSDPAKRDEFIAGASARILKARSA